MGLITKSGKKPLVINFVSYKDEYDFRGGFTCDVAYQKLTAIPAKEDNNIKMNISRTVDVVINQRDQSKRILPKKG